MIVLKSEDFKMCSFVFLVTIFKLCTFKDKKREIFFGKFPPLDISKSEDKISCF